MWSRWRARRESPPANWRGSAAPAFAPGFEEDAQEVFSALADPSADARANLAPAVLSVPDAVDVRKVDLSIELQILAFHEQRKAAGSPRSPGTAVPDDVRSSAVSA